MKSVSELINKINSLPKGNVYKKVIKGKSYYYHQYFDCGNKVTIKVKNKDLDELVDKIKIRKELENKLKSLKSSDKETKLSKNAINLTGSVMCENDCVATFVNGEMVYIDEARAPLIIKRTHSLESFLQYRTVDLTRTNARILKKAMNIKENNHLISLYTYALCIGDNYWFKPRNSKTKYKNIAFKNDNFSDIALHGDSSYFPRKSKITPELTTAGSYEKGWKYIDGEWWLYKKGKEEEIISELFCSRFARLIGVNTVDYELVENGIVRCKNFARQYNFEPMVAIAGNNDSYEVVFPLLYSLDKDIAKDYLKLIFFDSVVNNVDRHNENYGLLRDKKSGVIISLAPNFDNNLALISRGDLNPNPSSDGFIKFFTKFISSNKAAKEIIQGVIFPNIYIQDIKRCLLESGLSEDQLDMCTKAILARYEYLKKYINK